MTGARNKIARGKHHTKDLDQFIKLNDLEFLSKPICIPRPIQEGSREILYFWYLPAKPIPTEIAMIVGDAVQNLRSALDLAIVEIASKFGINDRIGFPFERDFHHLEIKIRKNLKNVPKSAKDIIKKFQPVKVNPLSDLRAIHDINNIDKHNRLIIAADMVPLSGSLIRTPSGDNLLFEPDLFVMPTYVEHLSAYELLGHTDQSGPGSFTFAPGSKLKLAWGQGMPLEGRGLMDSLTEFSETVEDVVNQLSHVS